jgi:hypothetical protein
MHRRHALVTMLLLALPAATLANGDTPPAGAAANPTGGARVRPYDRRSAALVVEGLHRSERLRLLIDQLEQRHVIVYVQMQPSLKGRLAGSLTWVAGTREFRYVRVSLNPELRGPAAIATLAHELQHALEVANEPSIIDAKSLSVYYRRNGINMSARHAGWDTEAARTVGDEVRQELAHGREGRIVESLRDFNPRDWHIVYRRARQR